MMYDFKIKVTAMTFPEFPYVFNTREHPYGDGYGMGYFETRETPLHLQH